MFFGDIEEIEITKDKNVANKLLKDGWFFLDIRGTGIHNGVHDGQEYDFVLILGRTDYPRWDLDKRVREKQSAAKSV